MDVYRAYSMTIVVVASYSTASVAPKQTLRQYNNVKEDLIRLLQS